MIVIGLTGNIACGKSTVMEALARLGAQVIDADKVVHEEMAPGRTVWRLIVDAFGDGILAADRSIDRAKLATIVFNDPAALARLEGITHPAAMQAVKERIDTVDSRVVVVEAVKLVEANWHQWMDSLWVVTCSPEVQFHRLTKDRGTPEAEARARLASQPPLEEKLRVADVVIDNSGTRKETFDQVERAFTTVMSRAKGAGGRRRHD